MKSHKIEYSINEFIESQENEEIKENKIKCDLCNNDKSLYNNNFYICTCKKNICQLCMINHIKNKEHNIFYYNKRYSYCNKHLIEFASYCSLCKMNLCEICEKDHKKNKNKIILYKKEKLDDKKKKEIEKEIKDNIEKINEYKNEINQINDIFKVFIKKINKDLDNYLINKLYLSESTLIYKIDNKMIKLFGNEFEK